MNQSTQAPRRKHLMDPNAPRKAPDPAELERLKRVQRIVTSSLLFTTILHLAVGLVIAADHVDAARTDAQIALITLGSACWAIGVLSVLAIHKRRLMSLWLLTSAIPAALGAWWVLLR